MNVSANYVDRISQGDIPAKITDTYNGDFNIIKNNLNTCIDAVNSLVADAGIWSRRRWMASWPRAPTPASIRAITGRLFKA